MVMGPAGTGKSTYCRVIQEHCQNAKRTVHVVNLDPAAESFEYDVAFDIRGSFGARPGLAERLALFARPLARSVFVLSSSWVLPVS